MRHTLARIYKDAVAATPDGAIPIAEKKAAADRLLAISAKYKGIANESYARESSLIESMLEDFGKAELADSVKALDGVGDLISGLRAAQDEFNKASDSATAAATSKGESAYAIKKPLLATINEKLVPYLTALGTLPDYKDFVAKCDAEIAKANASVAKKKAGGYRGERVNHFGKSKLHECRISANWYDIYPSLTFPLNSAILPL